MEQKILEEYIKSYQQLLVEKGFNESTLKNGEPEGTFGKMIDHGLKILVDSSETEGVSVSGVGLFGDEREPIRISFHFEYDRQREAINLRQVTGQSRSENMIIIPKQNFSFPTSQELYADILGYRKKQELKRKDQHRRKGPRL